MALRILRPDTAFANAAPRGQKRPRREDGAHLAWIRTLPCVITGERPVEAAHIRYGDPVYGKRETGKQEKPHDMWVLPLSVAKHREQHDQAEMVFWARHGLDPLRIALALHACTGDDDQAYVVLREAWKAAVMFEATRLWPAGSSEGD